MNVNGKNVIWSLIYLTEPLSFDITHKFASLSHFGNNFIIKLEKLYCISISYEDIVRFGGKSGAISKGIFLLSSFVADTKGVFKEI